MLIVRLHCVRWETESLQNKLYSGIHHALGMDVQRTASGHLFSDIPMNSIEQHVIVKGGTTCVFGTAERGFQWSNLAGDYLLSRLCASKRNKKVLCLNLDRKPSILLDIGTQTCSSAGREDNDDGDKVSLVDVDDVPFDELFESEQALKPIEKTISEWASRSLSYSIVVFSLSELVLGVGVKKAVNFMVDLCDLAQLTHSRSGSGSSSPPSVIFVVHESLHSQAVLTLLQSKVSTLVKVVPNRGTLSPEVVAEMQTVRKSASTGKVVECIEMFGYREGMLYPMATNASSQAAAAVPAEESEAEASAGSAIMSKLLNNGSPVPAAAAVVEGPVDTSKRLITFDSTDPEFDEDSDPDADLDL